MAKIRREFTMHQSPVEAQALFVSEIAPELARKTDLSLYRQRPGRLDFGYLVTPAGELLVRSLSRARPRRLKGYRVRVSFDGEGEGTRVKIRGRCERHICEALARLGEPGHWPAASDES